MKYAWGAWDLCEKIKGSLSVRLSGSVWYYYASA